MVTKKCSVQNAMSQDVIERLGIYKKESYFNQRIRKEIWNGFMIITHYFKSDAVLPSNLDLNVFNNQLYIMF